MTRLAILLLITVATTGCLQKETTHTLYLSPDGSVRWTVEESNVHSDEKDQGQRLEEEQAYIGPALIGAHRAALGLQAIGPDDLVRTTVIRDQRPFHVITDTRFFRIDRALDRLFREAGLNAVVTLDQDQDRVRLRMAFDFSRELEERNSPAAALLEDFENFRFVLTEGQFVAGGGFDVPGRTMAVISRTWIEVAERAVESKGQIELVLAWTRTSPPPLGPLPPDPRLRP